jgi:endogenous inhibitor of DNA gyrase (YacG/DUF329 family)
MKRCPICNKPEVEAHKPVCSERCAQIDLGRWLTESYRVPEKIPDEEDE